MRIQRVKGYHNYSAFGLNINMDHGDIPHISGIFRENKLVPRELFLEGLMHIILSPWGHPPISGTSGDKN
jgi:hypothetical protein